jgi:hypothetical protein
VIGRQEDALSEQIDADSTAYLALKHCRPVARTGLVLQRTPDDVEDGVPF